jgi:DNA-binding transcriptional ArsR family regulator
MRDRLSQTFAALADPTRRAMLARLSRGEASVTDLAKPFLKSMSLPAVTKHLQVLERAGLVTKTRDAQWRPCKLDGRPLKGAVDWMEQYRKFWEESLDRLGEYLKTVQKIPEVTTPAQDQPVAAAARKSAVKRSAAKSKPKGKKHAR